MSEQKTRAYASSERYAHLMKPGKFHVLEFQAFGVADIARDLNTLAYPYEVLHFGNLF